MIIWYVKGNRIKANSDMFRYKIFFSPVNVAKKLSTGEGLAMFVLYNFSVTHVKELNFSHDCVTTGSVVIHTTGKSKSCKESVNAI